MVCRSRGADAAVVDAEAAVAEAADVALAGVVAAGAAGLAAFHGARAAGIAKRDYVLASMNKTHPGRVRARSTRPIYVSSYYRSIGLLTEHDKLRAFSASELSRIV